MHFRLEIKRAGMIMMSEGKHYKQARFTKATHVLPASAQRPWLNLAVAE